MVHGKQFRPFRVLLAMPSKISPIFRVVFPRFFFVACSEKANVVATVTVYHYAKTLPFARLHVLDFSFFYMVCLFFSVSSLNGPRLLALLHLTAL